MKLDLPHVSDHAILRYLERAHGVPVEDIRKGLAEAAAIGVAHGAPVVALGRVKLVIRDRVVTTALLRAMATKPQRRGP